MLDLFRPPEWGEWSLGDRLAYVASLSLFALLMGLGVWKLRELIGL